MSHEKGAIFRADDLGSTPAAVIGLVLSTAILLASGTLHSWRAFAFACLALLVLIRWKLRPAFVLAVGAAAGTAAILQ